MTNSAKIRTYIKNKIEKDVTGLENYKKEKTQVYDLLYRTVNTGESNSALLIGPRAVGKTTLVNNVINELQQRENFTANSALVQLHGLIHTDDKLALKSITAQMQLDNAVEGKVFGTFAENLAFLLACLKTGKKDVSKSVIFILDEFDLFCAHHNQTLLYNLFDIAQSAQTPICVLGITCRLDVIELFEKRVKSRFSHRQIFLFPGHNQNSNISAIDHRLQRIEHLLSVTDDFNTDLTVSSTKAWNKSIKSLIGDKKFKVLIQRQLDIDSNEHSFKSMLICVISKLNDKMNTLHLGMFEEYVKEFENDDTVQMLQDLSVLELCLIIAIKHHVEIYDNQAFNFEMILSRYTKFISTNSNVQNVPRPVILKAFEHIQNLELILPIVNSGAGRLQKEYQLCKLLATPFQIIEAIKKSQGLPTEVIQWANSSLV